MAINLNTIYYDEDGNRLTESEVRKMRRKEIEEFVSKKRQDTEKYKADFTFLSGVMENGNGTVENKNVGEITFEAGEIGKSGYGIRHIIEQRYQKDGKNSDEITALMALVKDISENGTVTRENGRNIELQTDNGIVSIVRKESDDKPYKWVLTGFDDFGRKEATDAIQTVIAQYGYLPEYSSFRTHVGAVIASVDRIAQNEEKSISTQGETTMADERKETKDIDPWDTWYELPIDVVERSEVRYAGSEETSGYAYQIRTDDGLKYEIAPDLRDLKEGEHLFIEYRRWLNGEEKEHDFSAYIMRQNEDGSYSRPEDLSTRFNQTRTDRLAENDTVSQFMAKIREYIAGYDERQEQILDDGIGQTQNVKAFDIWTEVRALISNDPEYETKKFAVLDYLYNRGADDAAGYEDSFETNMRRFEEFGRADKRIQQVLGKYKDYKIDFDDQTLASKIAGTRNASLRKARQDFTDFVERRKITREQSLRNEENRSIVPETDSYIDDGIERMQANGGMSEAAAETEIAAQENPRPDYLDEQGNPHWYDEEDGAEVLSDEEIAFLKMQDEKSQFDEEQAEGLPQVKENQPPAENTNSSLEKETLARAGDLLKNMRFTPENYKKLLNVINEISDMNGLKNLGVPKASEIVQETSKAQKQHESPAAQAAQQETAGQGSVAETARADERQTGAESARQPGENAEKIPVFSMITQHGLQTFENCVVQKFNAAENSYTLSNGEATLSVTADTLAALAAKNQAGQGMDETSPAYEKLLQTQYDDYFRQRSNTACNFRHNLSVYCRREANSPLDALRIAKEIISRMPQAEREKTQKLLQKVAYENETVNEAVVRLYHEAIKEVPLNEQYIRQNFPGKVIARPMYDTVSDAGKPVAQDTALIKGGRDYNLTVGGTIRNVSFDMEKLFGKGKESVHFDELKVVSASKEANTITLMDKDKSYFKLPRDTVLAAYKEQQLREMRRGQWHGRGNAMSLGYV